MAVADMRSRAMRFMTAMHTSTGTTAEASRSRAETAVCAVSAARPAGRTVAEITAAEKMVADKTEARVKEPSAESAAVEMLEAFRPAECPVWAAACAEAAEVEGCVAVAAVIGKDPGE